MHNDGVRSEAEIEGERSVYVRSHKPPLGIALHLYC